jgi:4-alpha-glucanotransferase
MWRDHDDAREKQDHHRAYVTWLELQRFTGWAGESTENIPREFTPKLHEAFCRRVLESNAWLAIFMITDVFGQTMRFNVPGSFAESNWSVRLDLPVCKWDESPELSARIQTFARLLSNTRTG